MPFVSIDHNELRRFAAGVFAATGSAREEAETVANHLVEANLRGHDSHGVGQIPMYVEDRLAGELHPNRHVELIRDDGPFGVFDGGMGYGHVLAREATEWGIARAQAAGVKFGRKPKLSAFQRAEAIKRRAAGERLADIAKSYAVDISMISRL